jgi:PTH1 family peptidyl-tRNA hydrolase
MAWLQKRPQIGDSIQFYSTGLNKTKLLIGLGNPGKEYDLTRHNVGFACLDSFVAQSGDMESWILKKDLKSYVSSGRLGDTRVIAIKPTTFMNLSGEALQAVMAFYKISADHVLVVHDELDIDFGQIRLRSGGTSAGHNGLKSIIQYIGEDFGRARIGIGPKKPAKMDSADFVLQKFSEAEQAQLGNMYREIAAIISEYVFGNQLPTETRNFLV